MKMLSDLFNPTWGILEKMCNVELINLRDEGTVVKCDIM